MKKNYKTKHGIIFKTILLISFFTLLKTSLYSQTTSTVQNFIWCQGIIPSQPGVYIDTLTAINGKDSVVITNFQPCSQYTFNVTQTGNVLTVVSPITNSSYAWSGPCIVSGANTASVTISCTGTYMVIITDTVTGCSCTHSYPVQTIGINEAGMVNPISVYPNPSKGIIDFKGIKKDSKLYITDVAGKLIYSEKAINEKQKLDLSQKSKGIYFYKVEYEGEIYSIGKFILE